MRTDTQWCFKGADTFIFREEEKCLGLFDPEVEDNKLSHKDNQYLAGNKGITSQNPLIFISLCLPTCKHYVNLKLNIWYLQDGFSDTPRHIPLSLEREFEVLCTLAQQNSFSG